MTDFIPVNTPLLDGNEKKYVLDCVDTGWISSEGPYVSKLEKDLSLHVGRNHGIAVSSGSAALDVAVASLGIGEGDEVILPTHTIISCAASIVRMGAKPVVVDSDPSTWNMDISQIEDKITDRTKAIMLVHTFGLPVDVDLVLEIAKKHGLHVIEDAAQAIGLKYKENQCGSFGDISIFSFYPNKHITTGEGGIVLCDDDALAEKSQSFRNLCFQSHQRFVHEELGWNYRIGNMQAALGVAQLETLDDHLKMKRSIGLGYRKLFAGIEGIELPPEDKSYADNYYWVFGVVLKDNVSIDAKQAMAKLAKKGIGTRPFFWPMHEQPVFLNKGWFEGESYPVAENMARRGFYIPSGLGVTEEQQVRVVEEVASLISGYST